MPMSKVRIIFIYSRWKLNQKAKIPRQKKTFELWRARCSLWRIGSLPLSVGIYIETEGFFTRTSTSLCCKSRLPTVSEFPFHSDSSWEKQTPIPHREETKRNERRYIPPVVFGWRDLTV
jgi:hypothetical protein